LVLLPQPTAIYYFLISPRESRKNHDWLENLSATKGSHTTITMLRRIQLRLQLISSTMNSYVLYNKEYQVLICRQHKYAIPLKSIEQHFRDKHTGMPLIARQEIQELANTLALCEPKKVIISTERVGPIHGLEVQKGFQCNFDGCAVIQGTMNSVKQHSKIHMWHGNHETKWHEVDVQTFFMGTWSRYSSHLMILTGRYFPVYGTNELHTTTVVDQFILGCIEQSQVEYRDSQRRINEVKDTTSLVTT
jgi:hypothetical protein